jgi:histidinol-phosphate aminotransferase
MKPDRLVRPLVRKLHAYVPGEQPKIRGLVKLNTNENPYPPSPKVLKAVKDAVDGRLRLYPPPTAQRLREKLAAFHRCKPGNVIVGNGSDELLAMAVRTFVDPGGTVQGFDPSYSLYPVLAETHGARWVSTPLGADFSLPPRFRSKAALTFVTTPNAPSGRAYGVGELDALCAAAKGVVILDEAYVDFADGDAMSIALKRPNVLVARTFSKGYSLCFLRAGYVVGHPTLIDALDRIRDSYNVNGLAQVAALATLDDLPYYRKNFRKVVATRGRLIAGLTDLGFDVRPSSTNFVLAKPPRFPAKDWLGKLRARKVLVRWFDLPAVRDFLRITVGTDGEVGTLLKAAKAVLS